MSLCVHQRCYIWMTAFYSPPPRLLALAFFFPTFLIWFLGLDERKLIGMFPTVENSQTFIQQFEHLFVCILTITHWKKRSSKFPSKGWKKHRSMDMSINIKKVAWRHVLVVKSTCCTFRCPGLSFCIYILAYNHL